MIDKLIKKLEKGKDSDKVKTFSNNDVFKNASNWLPTGIPVLDLKLNTFGYPVGITEIRGESKSGKTTLGMHALKTFQEKFGDDGVAVILSTERRDNKVYAQSIGVDTDKILLINCTSIEDVFNTAANIIKQVNSVWLEEGKSGKPKFLFLWDSLGASISAQEKAKMDECAEGDDEDSYKVAMGAAARAIKRGFRYITSKIYDFDIFFLIINHTYNSMSGYGGKESYGGTGIEFFPSLRLNVTRTGFVKASDDKIGQTSVIEVVKSDFDSYLGKIQMEINFGKGYVLTPEELDFACENNLLEKVGKNGYSFMNGKLEWNTKRKYYDLYNSENPLMKILVKKVTKLMHEEVSNRRGLNKKEEDEE